MITYFKEKNHNSKKKRNDKLLTTKIKSFDTFVITTSSSITFNLTGIGLIAIPLSSGIARGLKISGKVLHEIVMQKYSKHKTLYEKTNKQFILLIIYTESVYKKI